MLGRRALLRFTNGVKNITRSASSSTSEVAVKANDAAIITKKDIPATLRQAPNYPTTWSANQAPRPGPGAGPRFEQTDMSLQPNPLSAMELVAEEPIRLVQGRKAVCDGGA
jgi:NADH dehydrogenase (ubiquinone) Fe-S protein 6